MNNTMNTEQNTAPVNDLFFEGKKVRVFGTPKNPLFVRADVGEILELANVRKLDLEPTELVPLKIKSGCQIREVTCVTTLGLYELVFKSRTKAAKRFRPWVFNAIEERRVKGFYSLPALNRIIEIAVRSCEGKPHIEQARILQDCFDCTDDPTLRGELQTMGSKIDVLNHELASFEAQPFEDQI
jgi:hypothetical protein